MRGDRRELEICWKQSFRLAARHTEFLGFLNWLYPFKPTSPCAAPEPAHGYSARMPTIELWLFTVTDPQTGKRRRTRYRLTVEEARRDTSIPRQSRTRSRSGRWATSADTDTCSARRSRGDECRCARLGKDAEVLLVAPPRLDRPARATSSLPRPPPRPPGGRTLREPWSRCQDRTSRPRPRCLPAHARSFDAGNARRRRSVYSGGCVSSRVRLEVNPMKSLHQSRSRSPRCCFPRAARDTITTEFGGLQRSGELPHVLL